jgi:ubiquinone/menaquinone biosynthesis C-methylase UbiE
MKPGEAIRLIRFEPAQNEIQVWADLGCGTGLFTLALASLLPKGSLIKAIDKDERSLKQIPSEHKDVRIQAIAADFVADQLELQSLDGILMANSLHYLQDKKLFLKEISTSLKAKGCFLIVDYDLNRSNPWVPYPLPLLSATQLFRSIGYTSFTLLNTRPSIYGSHNIYAAIVKA